MHFKHHGRQEGNLGEKESQVVNECFGIFWQNKLDLDLAY